MHESELSFQAVVDQWNKDNPGIQVHVQPRPDPTWQSTAPSTEFAASDEPLDKALRVFLMVRKRA